ncbi:MAG TPA: DUF1194 domain-containing protein [Hyphomonadaceae bacterium]|jgi:hypothetical protein|nr:DUF1194 domain-containing protein [Hyphomonadaceae bacterium]HPN06148.1 DUF1194 domain-containing protein [Hyphomonadaceae bacterium]
MNIKTSIRGLSALAIAAFAGLAAPVAIQSATAQQGQSVRVDLELLLAVDISQSMDFDEHTIQRNGYVEAFRHKDVINALTSGPEGKIAVMYMEWAGDFDPIPTIPWTIIDSAKAAHDFADRLENEPIFGEQRTSISTALYAAKDYILNNNISSHRQVIDVSGDGANNAGRLVEEARDDVVKAGIVINGLPIMLNKPREFYDIDHLDRYYKHCVIGGASAFIAPVFDLRHLSSTIRKKLVMEIASLDVEPDMAPIQFAEQPGLYRAQLKLPTEKTDCTIGEKVWGGGRGYYGGGGRRRP